MKSLTLRIDLTQFGTIVAVPGDEPAKSEAIKHNQTVRLRRRMEAAALEAQAQPLHLTMHVGTHAVLLRGKEEQVAKLVVPTDTCVSDASERWRGYR